MKKQSEAEKVLLSKIYNLILNPALSSLEREVFLEAKKMLELENRTCSQVIQHIRSYLRGEAIARRLSKPASDFYLTLNEIPVNYGVGVLGFSSAMQAQVSDDWIIKQFSEED
ncbi:MAG: bacteriocin immunity protein [Streptococcaceae bacterium]|jgi:hypothetical protein|nr:bacteriocin immunity protein [Streptococcaceae bacterium]